MKATLEPIHDRVLVRRIEEEGEDKVGSLFIPDSAKEQPLEAVVIAVGPGERDHYGVLHKPAVVAGDRVLLGKWSGLEVKVDGQDLLMLKEAEILGVFRATE